MSVEIQPPIEEEDYFTPSTAEEFEHFVHEELGGRLVEVSAKEVEQEKVLWRGHDPHDVAGLLGGHRSDISLDQQYVTLHRDRAISYNRGGQGITYNVAIGFVPPFEWESRPVAQDVPRDLRSSATVMQYQMGNFQASGHISSEHLKFVAIRPHGGPGNPPGEVKYYKVAA